MAQSLDSITVAIVARNAEATIARAIESALAAGASTILLVDDASTDGTIAAAEAVGDAALKLVKNETPVSVGHVRSLALNAIETEFGVWLDADDAFAPDHLERVMLPLTSDGADLVYSSATLLEGETGAGLKTVEIPDFMTLPGRMLRSFERNWLPTLTCAFVTEVAKSIGFDARSECAEDYDFLLRAVAGGASVGFNKMPSYQYFHYADTVSRNREKTAKYTAAALKKHDADWLGQALERAGYSAGDAACVLASKAMFERDFDAALTFATQAASSEDVVEPYAAPARHISAFFAGTAAAMRGYFADAMNILEPLGNYMERPEVYNNVAVCFAECGDRSAASLSLELALALNPNYLDAKLNKQALVAGEKLTAITLHPLRIAASRDRYAG